MKVGVKGIASQPDLKCQCRLQNSECCCNQPNPKSSSEETITDTSREETECTPSETTQKKPAWLGLASRFSGLYALLLIILGILFPLAETLQGEWLNSLYNTVFLVYIYSVGTICIVFMQVLLLRKDGDAGSGEIPEDESAGKNAATLVRKTRQGLLVTLANEDETVAGGSRIRRISIGTATPNRRRDSTISRTGSCSSLGSHDRNARQEHGRQGSIISTELSPGGDNPGVDSDDDVEVFIDVSKLGSMFSHPGSSFFLRVGALIFGIGHLIYDILEIRDMILLPPGCQSGRFWWIYFIRIMFLGAQTFVIFKNPSTHVKKTKECIARMCFTHLIATNVCTWIRTLINETMVDFEHYDILRTNVTDSITSSDGDNYTTPDPLLCRNSGVLPGMAVYLFPFILEYSLIALGILTIIYMNIKDESKNNLEQGLKNLFKIDVFIQDEIPNPASHKHKYLFAKSHRGIFFGFMFLGLTVISTVLFFAVKQDGFTISPEDDMNYLISDLVLETCLVVANVVAFIKLSPLSYVDKPCSVDDFLLLIAMAGSILFHVAIVMASANAIALDQFIRSTEILRMCSALAGILQTWIQVIQILNGMRRYPSKQEHVENMPGRGALTFLVIGNISAWIFRTMQAKTVSLQDAQLSFFGAMPWLLLMNTFLPFQLFYHFHASICLADVWHVAYKPLHSKIQRSVRLRTSQHRLEEERNISFVDLSAETTSTVFHPGSETPIRRCSKLSEEESFDLSGPDCVFTID